jgi:gliding motility-associated-like protein
MRTIVLSFCCFLLEYAIPHSAKAQEADPYHLNGSATQDNCNCYTLTQDIIFVSGSVWNKNEIDLTQSFDYKFNVYLGCKDLDGADGIVFVLQPISTSIGSSGQGLGFEGIVPSIGIPIDTYQNLDFGDPSYDHIGIYKNGDLHNGSPSVLAGPVSALATSDNIEDCQWHTFRISWDASLKVLSAFVDGSLRVQTATDLVKDIFNNQPMVFWGFSGATGSLSNIQKFCTSLNPGYSIAADQKTCYPTPVVFNDSSTSFGTILNWYWDFGDGTKADEPNPPPHVFPAPGIYNVKLNILANNGCLSDTFNTPVTIGSIPKAAFSSAPLIACTTQPTTFTDSSVVQYGTINEWDWNINNGSQTFSNGYAGLVETFPAGPQSVQLTVGTREGCVSAPYSVSFNVYPRPVASVSADDACYGAPVSFSAANTNPSVTQISQWYWNPGDSSTVTGNPLAHFYTKGGQYNVSVYALSSDGCYSDTASQLVTIYQTNAYAGNDTTVVLDQPLQLHGSGGELYRWTPPEGLSDASSPDPVAMISNSIDYVLEAYTSFGCPTFDTLHIKAFAGPAIYVPSAFTPDNNGRNDLFRLITVGITNLSFFNVYNRFGQLVFSSTDMRAGWDGNFHGQQQPTGTYVWMAKGTDYNGKIHYKQGTVVLIR